MVSSFGGEFDLAILLLVIAHHTCGGTCNSQNPSIVEESVHQCLTVSN